MFRLHHLLFPMLLCCALAACGGGGSSSGAPAPTLSTVLSTPPAPLDGYLVSGVMNVSGGLHVGDAGASFPQRGGYRSFLSFDHGVLPQGAIITGARLRVYLAQVAGTPVRDLGPVIVAHMDFGPTLEHSDEQVVALTENLGVLAADTQIGWKELDVSTAVMTDQVQGRFRSQFRLATRDRGFDLDLLDDMLGFEDVDNSFATGHAPQLIIQYRLP